MSCSPAHRSERGRKTISASLRALAALLAVLLTASSLGQTAHFVLIPHQVCEHGELVEQHEREEASSEAAAADMEQGTHASAPATEDRHDHCQMLARAQRELALLSAHDAYLLPSGSSQLQAVVTLERQALPTLAALDLAPKTSPPVAAFG